MISINELHNVVIDDGCFAEVGGQRIRYCLLDNVRCRVIEEARGKKSKFWIIAPSGERYLLKYDEHQTQTMENVGQFIMNGVFEQIDIPHAKYFVVDFTENEVPTSAIMSLNFKPQTYRELSAFTIGNKLKDYLYDNFNGANTGTHHTVEFYDKALRLLYRKNDVNFDKITADAKKYCLLQNLFMMTDLHFYNLSYLFDEKKGHQSLSLSPFYDCGNICCLNLSSEKVKNFYEGLVKTRKPSVYIDEMIIRRMPMFGMKTELSGFDYASSQGRILCRPVNEELYDEDRKENNKNLLQQYRLELATELYLNDEFNAFFEKVKTVDFEKIYTDYNNIKEGTIPDYCIQLVKGIFEYNVKSLDKILTEIKRIDAKYHSFKPLEQGEE